MDYEECLPEEMMAMEFTPPTILKPEDETDEFDEYIKRIKANGIRLECPYGCSCKGYLCSGNPYTTPCGRAIEVKEDEYNGEN